MAQSIITAAFEAYKAQQEALAQPVALDEFVLAMVPEQDHNQPIDANESLPPETQIVHVADVTQTGYVNPNAVAYSITLDTRVGDFEFNWIGLRNKASGTLAAISHIPTIQKYQSIAGVQNGNAVTRSILMSYQDAKNLTGITVDASSWQIDFTARLFGIDENERLVNLDVFGHGAFLGDGFKVVKSGLTYSLTQGRGYVGGLRCHLDADTPLTGVVGGVSIYLDASWQGHVTSQWNTVFSVTVTDEALTDYVGADGYQHYVTKLADVDAAGNVTDCRYLEGFAQYYKQSALDEMLGKKVDQSTFDMHKHNASDITAGTLAKERLPDATTSAKGAVTLTDSTSSSSSVLAATAKAVKAAYDLAYGKWSAVNASTTVKGIVQLSTSVNSTSSVLAATASAVKTANDKAVSAYNLANGKADAGHSHTASDVNAVETKSVHNTWYVYNSDHYCRVVILLVRHSSATTGALAGPFSLSGNLVSYRGGSNSSMSHTSVDLSVHSAYSSNSCFWTTRSNQRAGRLVTCMYGGVKYWAWDITSGNNAQDNMNYFRGFVRGVDSNFFKVVRYQGTGDSAGQSTIVNAEVYNSLAVASSINPKVATYPIYHSGNKPTPEDLGAMTEWKLLKSGTCSVAAKNSATGTYVTTIDTGIAVTARQFDPKRYKVVLANSGNSMSASDPSSCWWSAWARVLPRTRWSGTSTVTFAVYCAGSGINSGTGVGQWSLYEAV